MAAPQGLSITPRPDARPPGGGGTAGLVPAFAPVALQLLKLTSEENACLPQIASLIRADPAITMEVLRLANSPLFGARREITGVLHALAMLGMRRIRSMVTVVAIRDFMAPARNAEVFAPCWRHCLAAAFIAESLSDGMLNPDTCYTAALIHELGQLALIAGYPREYDQLVCIARQDGVDLLALERECFGTDRHRLGLSLIRKWGLPPHFQMILAFCDPHATPSGIGALVRTACQMAQAIGFRVAEPDRPWNFEQYPQLDPDTLAASVGVKINTLECSLVMV